MRLEGRRGGERSAGKIPKREHRYLHKYRIPVDGLHKHDTRDDFAMRSVFFTVTRRYL